QASIKGPLSGRASRTANERGVRLARRVAHSPRARRDVRVARGAWPRSEASRPCGRGKVLVPRNARPVTFAGAMVSGPTIGAHAPAGAWGPFVPGHEDFAPATRPRYRQPPDRCL